jgi:trk system potassium uptake protein TrkH
MPFSSAPDYPPLRPVNALFVSTSAVCVTGLTPIEVGTRLSPTGQAILLLLIQVGGLGFLTLSTGLLLSMGLRSSMVNQTALVESLSARGSGGLLRGLVRVVFLTTIAIELTGAIVLTFRFQHFCGLPWLTASWYGLFHAISAFCNAGFSLFSPGADGPGNLMRFSGDWLTNMVVCGLIILGGLGFPVLDELLRWAKSRAETRLGLHTRIVLTTSGVLILAGAAIFFFLEYGNPGSMGGRPIQEQVLASLFQSITARTAGFNTVDVATLRSQTIMLLIVLMFIGGSPASCAGGIKTTTSFVLAVLVVARLRSRRNPTAFGREIDAENVSRAGTLTLVALVFVVVVCGAVLFFQPQQSAFCAGGQFMDLLFETVSAFGTVGLSTGVTAELTSGAKMALVLCMFVGRVGPLTLFVALARPPREDRVRLPAEPVVVG